MQIQSHCAITISRQLGCGGSYLGQRLARRLSFKYADREILQQAAVELEKDVSLLASRDERASHLWEAALAYFYVGPLDTAYQPPALRLPSDRELFAAENAIIKRLAEEEDVIIVGHGGVHVLRDHPGHISFFFHAPITFRTNRVMSLYNVNEQEAARMIATADNERERYIRTLTGYCWNDLRNYDLCVDTSSITFSAAEQLLLDYLVLRGVERALLQLN